MKNRDFIVFSFQAIGEGRPPPEHGQGVAARILQRSLIWTGILLLTALTACSDGETESSPLGATPTITGAATVNSTLTPTSPPTQTPTPSSSPAISTTYRLIEGSTILSSPAPAGVTAPTLEEPLSGTFVVVPQPYGPPSCLNTVLCLSVVSFYFQSAHFILTGSSGLIYETTFVATHTPRNMPATVQIGLRGSINAEPIGLGGFGSLDPSSSYPPCFNALELCGAPPGVGGSCAGIRAGADVGYDLILLAVPAS